MVGCPHEVAVGGILAGPGLRGDDPLLRLTHRGGGAAEQLPLFSFGVEDVAVPVRGQLLSGAETDADEQAFPAAGDVSRQRGAGCPAASVTTSARPAATVSSGDSQRPLPLFSAIRVSNSAAGRPERAA